MKFSISRVPGGCGIINFYEFKTWSPENIASFKAKKSYFPSAGWIICSYVTTGPMKEACEQMYAEMLDSGYPLVFESEVRRNHNSDNDFFFVIYDSNGEKK